jgi:hypothetical protein
MRSFFATVLMLGFAALAVFGLTFGSYKMYEFFAPRYTAVDAKVFKESVQYNEGMLRDLTELQRQYVTADDAGKAALRPIIRHRFEVYDITKLPPDLQEFYVTL